jgi:hypothetical protein
MTRSLRLGAARCCDIESAPFGARQAGGVRGVAIGKESPVVAASRDSSRTRRVVVGGQPSKGRSMSEQPRHLYLDLDGVLHPSDVVFRTSGPVLTMTDRHRLLEHADTLVDILAPYRDLRVVLSSAWVVAYGFPYTLKRLPPALQMRVVGATFDETRDGPSFSSMARGYQVLQDVQRRLLARWIALDDDVADWPDSHRRHLVRCNPTLGLGDPAVVDALRTAVAEL